MNSDKNIIKIGIDSSEPQLTSLRDQDDCQKQNTFTKRQLCDHSWWRVYTLKLSCQRCLPRDSDVVILTLISYSVQVGRMFKMKLCLKQNQTICQRILSRMEPIAAKVIYLKPFQHGIVLFLSVYEDIIYHSIVQFKLWQ